MEVNEVSPPNNTDLIVEHDYSPTLQLPYICIFILRIAFNCFNISYKILAASMA